MLHTSNLSRHHSGRTPTRFLLYAINAKAREIIEVFILYKIIYLIVQCYIRLKCKKKRNLETICLVALQLAKDKLNALKGMMQRKYENP
jgi:hypothetical protein